MVEWVGTAAFGILAAIAWITLSQSPIGRALITHVTKPVERPANVDAFVANLKTAPLLSELQTNPTSCSHVPKAPPRDRCNYRAGDFTVFVAWRRQSGRFTGLSIQRTEPQGSPSFAWTGLADMLSRLCAIDVAQAENIVRDIPDRLSRARWLDRGEPAAPEGNTGWRSTHLTLDAGCVLDFAEGRTGRDVQARFSARRFQMN